MTVFFTRTMLPPARLSTAPLVAPESVIRPVKSAMASDPVSTRMGVAPVVNVSSTVTLMCAVGSMLQFAAYTPLPSPAETLSVAPGPSVRLSVTSGM